MTPLSIIVPAHRHEHSLPRCIRSILAQTLQDFVLILVHWRSETCRSFAAADSRIQLVEHPPNGITAARRAGAAAATTEYIAFVDSDDWVHPSMYETLLQAADAHSADVVICDYFRVHNSRKSVAVGQSIPAGVYKRPQLRRAVYPIMLFSPTRTFRGVAPALWNKLLRTEMVRSCMNRLPGHISIAEDVAVVYPVLLHSDTVVVLHPAPLYYYRQHPASYSRIPLPDSFEQTMQVCDHLLRASAAAAVYDIRKQIDGNRCYFAAQSILDYTRRVRSIRARMAFIRRVQGNAVVQQSLQHTNPYRFYVTYRVLWRLMKKKRTISILLVTAIYPLLVRIVRKTF